MNSKFKMRWSSGLMAWAAVNLMAGGSECECGGIYSADFKPFSNETL